MSQSKRVGITVLILVIVIGAVIAIESWRASQMAASGSNAEVTLEAGSVPIFVNGTLIAGFLPTHLEPLNLTSFVDAEESKMQEGWLLSDPLNHYANNVDFTPATEITVSSSSREKSITLTWAELDQPDNIVLFDLSGRGTLKLAAAGIDRFDTRDEWVQDVDKIEIRTVGE